MTAATRENATAKAHRLLAEGRLIVRRIEPELLHATCRGDSGEVYDLGYDGRKGQWRCTCAAKSQCSHLKALMLVTVKP